jgi:hypothetical protein
MILCVFKIHVYISRHILLYFGYLSSWAWDSNIASASVLNCDVLFMFMVKSWIWCHFLLQSNLILLALDHIGLMKFKSNSQWYCWVSMRHRRALSHSLSFLTLVTRHSEPYSYRPIDTIGISVSLLSAFQEHGFSAVFFLNVRALYTKCYIIRICQCTNLRPEDINSVKFKYDKA